MMIRPSDQIKLLFLYFLRSSAALATPNPLQSSLASASTSSSRLVITPPPPSTAATAAEATKGHINFRVARRTDIPSIQRCNLATLPENYNSNFYLHHMRTWPELALVMEHVEDDDAEADDMTRRRRGLFSYEPDRETNIIGYVLGKVEESPAPSLPTEDYYTPRKRSRVSDDDGFYPRQYLFQPPQTEKLGHVTSLAILDPYRRHGLAGQLMDQLHFHMRSRYSADAVGLHVRVSNCAAKELYTRSMGYSIADVIRNYYQDGEDAFLMRKEFDFEEERVRGAAGWRWRRNRDKAMELPRRIVLCDRQQQQRDGDVQSIRVSSDDEKRMISQSLQYKRFQKEKNRCKKICNYGGYHV